MTAPSDEEQPTHEIAYHHFRKIPEGTVYYSAAGRWWLHDPKRAQWVDQDTLEPIDIPSAPYENPQKEQT